jgi:hypothetical protein
MKILTTFYAPLGRSKDAEITNWREAEDWASYELLETMDFKNIIRLTELNPTFPFDFVATKIIRPDPFKHPEVEHEGERYLIDVTLRTRKRVKRKNLAVWRALGFKTALLMMLPEKQLATLIEIEPADHWVSLTPTKIKRLIKEQENFFKQRTLDKITTAKQEP